VKTILILTLLWTGQGIGGVTTAEFDSMEACQAALKAAEKELAAVEGICVPKGDE
jgi:hypothetical protein